MDPLFFWIIAAVSGGLLLWSLFSGVTDDRIGLVSQSEDPGAYWSMCGGYLLMTAVFSAFALAS